MHQNRLFNRTRIQLTFTYGLVIGLITLFCGSAIHFVMIRAFARTADRELNILAGAVRDPLEAVLQQPEIVNPAAMNLLPGLCIVGKECSSVRSHSRITELTRKQGYSLRLLSLKGRAIATLGVSRHQLIDKLPTTHWETITDDRGERYHTHTLLLKTTDNRDWGYLQVAQSFHRLDDYMHSLHLILILGTPLAMLLISGSSWWLSGLAMRPIYQSYQQIQQFTVDAAHELRTPLAVTRIAVESALDVELIEPETRNNLEIAQRQVRHLSCLAEDLLWLSRLETKQLPLRLQLCCLNDLVSDLEEELAPLAIANEIDLRLEILVSQPIYVIGDNDRLYRAISNLINNAIHYTPIDGVVAIRLESSDRHATISVQDNGIGIDPEDLPHIFDRFYRVQTDRSRNTGGTGLGLAIARAIVEAHHGSIQVDSKLDLGSTFTVSLPIKPNPNKTRSDLFDRPLV
jgi:signal transduction histidine kinase